MLICRFASGVRSSAWMNRLPLIPKFLPETSSVGTFVGMCRLLSLIPEQSNTMAFSSFMPSPSFVVASFSTRYCTGFPWHALIFARRASVSALFWWCESG